MNSQKKAKKKPAARDTSKRKLKRKSRGFFGSFGSFAVLGAIWGIAIILAIGIYQATQLPDLSKLELKKRDIGVRLLNKKGTSFATYGDF